MRVVKFLALFAPIFLFTIFVGHAMAQSANPAFQAAAELIPPAYQPYLAFFVAVVGAAKLIIGTTPTPAPGTFYAGVYKGIELLALVTSKMKQGGGPPAALFLLCVLVGAAGALAACSTAPATATATAALLSSPVGQSLVSGVGNFSAPVAAVVTKINAGLATTTADKAMVCGGMSWADTAFQALAPVAGASAVDITAEQASMVAVNALCSGTTTDLASAVGTVAGAYLKTTAALQASGMPVNQPSS